MFCFLSFTGIPVTLSSGSLQLCFPSPPSLFIPQTLSAGHTGRLWDDYTNMTKELHGGTSMVSPFMVTICMRMVSVASRHFVFCSFMSIER